MVTSVLYLTKAVGIFQANRVPEKSLITLREISRSQIKTFTYKTV